MEDCHCYFVLPISAALQVLALEMKSVHDLQTVEVEMGAKLIKPNEGLNNRSDIKLELACLCIGG